MKMSLEIILAIIAVGILIFLAFYFAERLMAPVTVQNPGNQVCFGQKCFSVELAKTDAEREKGLMNRASLKKNKGMFFIFDKEGMYPFWMENTLIPLDMIWIDGNDNVVFIANNVQPCKTMFCPSVVPSGKAKYVLELNAGICQEIGLKVGDKLEIKAD